MMSERNMEGFSLHGSLADSLNGELIPPLGEGSWILVPDSILSANARVLAFWENDSMEFPALVMNQYGKGLSFLLPSSYLLHPSNEGGHWSAVQIDAFCTMVLDEFYRQRPVRASFSPWPDGHPAAFAVSLNADGDIESYKRTFGLLADKNVTPTLFVNGDLDEEIRSFLKSTPHKLQSNGWRKTNMRNLTFSETVLQLEMNEQVWDQDFSGFRFPYTLNSVWGMEFLQRKGYSYESSIGIDHTLHFQGSLYPYHLPVFQGENYQVLDLIEISPVAKDDYFYFRMIQEAAAVNPTDIEEKAQLFDGYLRNFWQKNTLTSGGMMVYLGHPLFSGYNSTTIYPLGNLIDTARKQDAWITTMEDIATRWKIIDQIQISIETLHKTQQVYAAAISMPPGMELKGATLRLLQKPKQVKALQGKARVLQQGDYWLMIFDATDGQRVSFTL
jgi:hypothetical protein